MIEQHVPGPPDPGAGSANPAKVDRSRMYRVPAVAAMLDVSRSTMYRAVASGQVPAVRIGVRSVRLHGATVAALLESGLPEPTPAQVAS